MKRHVAYIRQSLHDSSSSSPERQRDIIEAWAKTHGIIISHYYIDIGGRRSESDNVKTRPNFQALLADADAQKFDVIVVSAQDRFGSSDFYEFVSFLDRFNKHGVELWDAGKNQLLNAHATESIGILQSTLGTIIETGEQVIRSKNTITGQATKARTGTYLGGPITYGVAIQCVTNDGKIRWTCEMAGPGLYEATYNDSRVTVLPYTPTGDRGPTDHIVWARSIYSDRVEAIKLIYRSYIGGSGTGTIAGLLTSLGYRRPGNSLPFSCGFIHLLIKRGHIYTGKLAYFKSTRGKFHRGTSTSPVPVKNTKGGITINPIEEWLISEQVFEPIISLEEYHRARELLVTRSRPRTLQNQKSLYAGYIVCDGCGKVMTSDGAHYRCTTYLNNGGPRSGCYRNRVKASTIDKYVEDWLVSTGTVLEWCTEGDPVTSLYKQVRLVNDRSSKLRMIIENYLADKLATVFPFEEHDGARYFEIGGQEIVETAEGTEIIPITHKFSLPGYTGDPGVLQELLSLVESNLNSSGSSQRAALESRKSHILRIFPEALNKSLRDSLVLELNHIDSQLEAVGRGVTDYSRQHRNLLRTLHGVYRDIKIARTVTAPSARRAALMGVVRFIRCMFVQKIVGSSSRSCLVSVTVIPNTGPALGDVCTTGPC